ncbi:outer membrane beta-barrel family protein [Phenylobacterium sp.]|uniref:TonB-dependent receptor n=1 Tax=Phenylobacterium sp. TaxID=1871053 RepID=UPI002F41EC4E
MRRHLVPLAPISIVIAAACLPSLGLAQEKTPQPDAAPATARPDDAPPSKTPPARTPPTTMGDKPAGRTKTVGEVVVTGQTSAPQISIDRKSYSVAADLQAQSGGAVADVLRNVPSVQVDPQGNVSLRGDSNVTILIDGKPSSLFEGDNKAQALQSLPADSIERVEVITNPSAEFRADGTAGIINLISKKARGVGATGSLRLTVGDGDRFVVGASGGYNSPRLSMAGGVTVRQDTQKSPGEEDRVTPDPAGGSDATQNRQQTHLIGNSVNARGSIDYDLTPRLRIGAEAHANYVFFRVDDPEVFAAQFPNPALDNSFQRQLSVHQKRASGEASVNLKQKLGSDGDFTLSLSHERTVDPRVRSGRDFDLVPAGPGQFDQQRIDNHQHRTELKGDLVQPFADMSKLKLGFDVEYDDNAYRNRGFAGPTEAAMTPNAALTNLFDFRQTISAAYATYEKPFGPFTVLGGLRVEDVRIHLDQVTLGQKDENDYLRAYPSLHLAWKLSDDQTLTGSYSHRVQRPDPVTFNAFRFENDPLNFTAGNPGLKPQQTQSFEVGYENRVTPITVLATAYYRENRDGFAGVLVDLGGGVELNELGNLARGRSAGLELNASGKINSQLSFNLNGDLAWTQLDSLGPLFAPTRATASFGGQGSLTWTATSKDLFQLNGFMIPKVLGPQGFGDPMFGIDLGYRRRLSERLSLVATAQDIFHSFHQLRVIDTPVLVDRLKVAFDTSSLRVGLTYSFGGGKAKDPGFEFEHGGGPGR